MGDPHSITDVDRALSLLVHDIRTPLGVALGYLRLLRAGQLGGVEEHDRAFARTMQALGGIADLCQSAESFLPGARASITTTTLVPTAELVERVTAAVCARGVALSWTAPDRAVRVAAGTSAEALATAIGLVLCGAPTKARYGVETIQVETRPGELHFLSALAYQLPALVGGVPTPFDPWLGHGLEVAAACQALVRVGGRVYTTSGAPGARAVSLPVEMSVP